MAKTVFGIPGVNDKSAEGAPVAPGKPATPAVLEKPPQAQVTPAPAKAAPMASPVIAKPMPATASAPAATAKAGPARTVFGMPAVKMPTGAPAAASVAAPVAAQASDDEFGATMIGAPAMTQENIQASVEAAKQATRTAEGPVTTPEKKSEPPVATDAAVVATSSAVMNSAESHAADTGEWQPPPEPSSGLVIGLIVGLVCIIGAILLTATLL